MMIWISHLAKLCRSELTRKVVSCFFKRQIFPTVVKIHLDICSRNKFATPIDEKALKPL